MKKYHARQRVSKEDLKPDRFQQATEKVAEFYYRDRQKFFIILGAALVVIVGLILVLQSRRPGANPEAQLRFTEALGIYSQGQVQESEDAFRDVATRFGRDAVGVRARYYLGQIYFQTGRYEEARREFGAFLKGNPKDPILGPGALIGVADCLQETGKPLKAAETYEQAWRRYPQSPLAEEAAMAAGRNYADAGALDRAEKLYRALLDKEPTGEKAEVLKMQLSHVRTLKEKF
ncbi:MAG: tetratricopeptide repeat protein [bacterium]